jgi:hypothetical protein
MKDEVLKGAILRTVTLAAAVVVTFYLLGWSSFVRDSFHEDVSFMLYPIIAVSIGLYAASLFDVLFTGELAGAVRDCIRIFAVGLLISFTLVMLPTVERLHQLGWWVLAGSSALIVAYLGRAVSSAYETDWPVVFSASVSLLAAGFIGMNAVRLFSDYVSSSNLEGLDWVVLWSFVAVSGVALLGLLKGSRNPVFSFVGARAGWEGLALTFTAALFLQLYFRNWRSTLPESFSPYLAPVEWGIVCLTVLAVFLGMRSFVARSLSEEQRLGEWKKLVQKVAVWKDRVEEVAGIAGEFVEKGFKDRFIVYIVATLCANEVPSVRIEKVVNGLVDYSDLPEPRLFLVWRLGRRERENKDRRLKVLYSTLEKIADTIGLRSSSILPVEDLLRDKT